MEQRRRKAVPLEETGDQDLLSVMGLLGKSGLD